MTRELYEEALADVRQVKKVAEQNAYAAILEAVEPRVRDLIDRAIFNEANDASLNSMPGMPGYPGPHAVVDELPSAGGDDGSTDEILVDADAASAIAAPDADGKIVLDIGGLCGSPDTAGAPVEPPLFGERPDDEYEISLESASTLRPVVTAAKRASLEATVRRINEDVELLRSTSGRVQRTPAFRAQIAQMISRVQHTYDHVQENVADQTARASYETTLETNFRDLNNLQESTTMSGQTNKNRMNEGDVTLKLTGLPDDIDLEAIGVDLVSDDEDADADDGGDLSLDDDASGGQQGAGDQQGAQLEAQHLDDDTIVEIDEKMLRREISRLREARLREEAARPETKPQSWGNGPDNFDNFGDGVDEGEPTDAEIVDKSTSPGALPLGEADGDGVMEDELHESDLDESDDVPMVQTGNRRREDEFGATVANDHSSETWDKRRHEGVKRLAYEKKLQERAQARGQALRAKASTSQVRRNPQQLAEVKREYKEVATRFNESVARSRKIKAVVSELTKKINEQRSNSAATLSEAPANAILRKKLAETNLFNAKLLFTNKLLQHPQLTNRQQATVIKQLDGAKTIRECRLIYQSLTQTLGSSSRSVNENADRKIGGSGSRPTQPASKVLNESHESERWAVLAGITPRK